MPIMYVLFLFLNWNVLSICIKRMALVCILIFALRIDRCIILIRMYLKQSKLEYESTIIFVAIYLMNKLEES